VAAISAVPAPGDRPVADLAGLLERGADAAVDLGLHPPDEPEPLFDGTLRLPLPPPVDLGHAAPQWDVTAAAISEVGDVSPVTRAVVAIDDVAPSVIVEVPFVLPPWPFTASIRGTTEAGSTVTTPDGTTLPVAPDGTFDLARRLAPWPQRVELLARDAVGNETVVRFDLVGGPDFRRLPWPLIALVTLVGAAAFGGRARRGAARASAAPDGMNVIEELDPAEGAAQPSGDGR
jgi:hypothetical protein